MMLGQEIRGTFDMLEGSSMKARLQLHMPSSRSCHSANALLIWHTASIHG